MARKRIHHREELARRIRRPPNSVRRSFDEHWEGEATGPIVVAIARELQVDSRKLIRDPRSANSAAPQQGRIFSVKTQGKSECR